jgi:release factor glutamine methyltransferase
MGHPKSWLLAHSEAALSPIEIDTLQQYKAQLRQGFPLPYLLGSWEFYGRKFEVNTAVLIPRPETELLIATALTCIQDHPHPLIIDVGTGSGIIAVTLACELARGKIIGADISRPALETAARNAQRLAPGQIHWLQADLMTPIQAQFDLICANLPYIPTGTLDGLPELGWEPRTALDGGKNGLKLIEALLRQARTRLSPKGWILLEIEATLGPQALALAGSLIPGHDIRLQKDLAEKDRLLIIGP